MSEILVRLPEVQATVQGHFRVLFLYDVCESIQLDKLRTILQSSSVEAQASRSLPIPHYLKFERPPVTEPIGLMVLDSGAMIEGRTKYYDYGVISIEMELAFEGDWDSLVSQSSRWIGAPELEMKAKELLRGAIEHAGNSVVRPYKNYLNEDYFIVQLKELVDPNGTVLGAKDLLASHAREIAQLVRGESVFLSEAETQEVLQSSISYSRTDVLVVGWSGALVYGGKESAGTTIQLLEYANTQLLEFRFYDSLLTRLLDDVYRSLEHKSGVAAAWRLSREAARLNTLRLDVMELTEKVDNAIKFLSDMFYARLYGLAAAKVGVVDYRRLVDQKLRTAGELYRFMVDQFNQTRSFILELAVVIILIIEIVFLFRGK
ncbi:MAG: hypothetical protein WCA91_16265 [Candidatus Acidiferrales bacterium]